MSALSIIFLCYVRMENNATFCCSQACGKLSSWKKNMQIPQIKCAEKNDILEISSKNTFRALVAITV